MSDFPFLLIIQIAAGAISGLLITLIGLSQLLRDSTKRPIDTQGLGVPSGIDVRRQLWPLPQLLVTILGVYVLIPHALDVASHRGISTGDKVRWQGKEYTVTGLPIGAIEIRGLDGSLTKVSASEIDKQKESH